MFMIASIKMVTANNLIAVSLAAWTLIAAVMIKGAGGKKKRARQPR